MLLRWGIWNIYMNAAAVVEVILDHCGKTLIHESCGT